MRFLVPDHSGHRCVDFDTADPVDMERAAKLFDELVHDEKKTAYAKKEGKASVTRSLDPSADETVFFNQLAGG